MNAIRLMPATVLAAALAAAPPPPGNLVLVNQGGPQDNDSSIHSDELTHYQAIQWTPAATANDSIARYRIYRNGIAYATVSSPTRFQGYISGTTLRVTSVSSGTVIPGPRWAGAGVITGTLINGPQLSGRAGGRGSYPVNISQKVGSFWHPVTFTAWVYIDAAAPGSNDPDFNTPLASYSYAVAAVDAAGREGPPTSQYAAYGYQNGYSNWNGFRFDYGGAVSTYDSTGGQPPHGAHDLEADFTAGGGLNLVAGSPQAPEYDLNIGAFRYFTIDINPGSPVDYTLSVSHVSRLPPGDVYGWLSVANVFAYGPRPVPHRWATYKIPLAALGIGRCTFTGSIRGNKLTVTAIDSGPAIIDAGGFVTGPGIPAGTYITAYGQKRAIGTFTITGPGITAATRVGGETMSYQRISFYKSTVQPDELPGHGGSRGRVRPRKGPILYIDNFGWTVN